MSHKASFLCTELFFTGLTVHLQTAWWTILESLFFFFFFFFSLESLLYNNQKGVWVILNLLHARKPLNLYIFVSLAFSLSFCFSSWKSAMDACVKQELVVPWSAVDEIHVGFIFLLRLY
jgi:hypothetical protein